MSMSTIVINKKPAVRVDTVANKYGFDLYLDEEYPYLDKKPGAERRAGGNAKGRRRAVNAMLARKLSHQAYLIKSIVDAKTGSGIAEAAADGTALLGKKRRVRLLSEHVQDFNIAVPYSLNRKNRWRAADDSAAGCLAALADSAPKVTCGDPHVKLSVVQSYFNLNRVSGNANVTAYHELDADGAVWLSSESRSARGAPLKDFMNIALPLQEENGKTASDADNLHIQYHLSRAHYSPNLMSAHVNTSEGKGVRYQRTGVYTRILNGKCAAGCRADRKDAAENFYAPSVLTAAERSERVAAAAAAAAAQSAPRRLFSLADFVVENSTPPVIVRRAKAERSAAIATAAEKNEIENQFVVTAASELEDDLLGDKLDKELDDEDKSANDIEKMAHRWAKRYDTKFTTFKSFDVSANRYDINSSDDWEALAARLTTAADRAAWHQNANRLAVDASAALARRMSRDTAGAPLLIVIVEYHEAAGKLKVLINGAFSSKLTRSTLAGYFGSHRNATADFDALLEEIIGVCAYSGIEFPPPSATTVPVPYQKRSLHGREIIATATATTIDEIVARDAVNAAVSIISDGGEETESEVETDEDLNLDDFEHIDMDAEFGVSIVQPAEITSAETTVVESAAASSPKCRACSAADKPKLIRQPDCGHIFCASCLNQTFVRRARFDERSLACPDVKCAGHVTLATLQTVVPLAVVAQLAVAHHLAAMPDSTRLLAICPHCDVYLSAESAGDYDHVACGKCEIVFCAGCQATPHWPLSCAHAAAWTEKFEAQVIARDVAARCADVRSRRADTSTGRQLARNLGRLITSRLPVAEFVEKRKMALHVIEYGFAWLYMNRGAKAKVDASQLKPSLAGLYKKMEILDNELLFSGSLTDVARIVGKVADMTRAVDAVVAKFKSVC